MNDWAITIALGCAGIFFGACGFYFLQRLRIGKFQEIAQKVIFEAERQAEAMKKDAEALLSEKRILQSQQWEEIWQQERKKIRREEERLEMREDKLESRLHAAEKKQSDLEKREAILALRESQLDTEKEKAEEMKDQLRTSLEQISGLSAANAKEYLLKTIQDEVRLETAHFIQRAREEAASYAESEAVRIISTAINRLASSTVSEVTTCTVSFSGDDMKGRIIGREGRNIRALEKACGVTFLLDDTPQAVVISSFDPIRKAIAKMALTELIQDGRIHPTRIEEAVEKATKQMQKLIQQHGQDATLRIGAVNVHPELITLLGKLKFRFSFGQNILDHSLEVAHLLGIMASELNLDSQLAKRIGLLHDIGKAVSHEVQGSHAMIGYDLALKYGESKEVANGIGCHHFELDPITIEGSLCHAADAISASRPGARLEAAEEYIRRLKKLEEAAQTFTGVEKAYALQAGREVRVFVQPEVLSDEDLVHLARNLTKKIETELDYPGKIKITILREKRVIDYAM
jgi:ribonuclease Y